MERVGVVVHPTRRVLDAVEVLESWTADNGLELVQLQVGEQPSVAPPGEVSSCDLVVALGGDGTVLKGLHVSAASKNPVLGVAYGSLGAMTTVKTDQLAAALRRFAAGDWHARELPALVLRAPDQDPVHAINDVVIARGRGTQLLIDVTVDGELYARLAGDGIVIATPLGSSAYSMAAGGALVAAGADAFACTPLAMHGGSAPPIVVDGDSEVTLDVHPGHSGYYVDVDAFPVDTGAREFTITREHAYATLVAFERSSTGLRDLRERGLISDAPRVIGQERRAAETEVGS